MANICDFTITITPKEGAGTLDDALRIANILKGTDEEYRVFRTDVSEIEQNESSVSVYGCCAWSVYSCMESGSFTYYDQFLNPDGTSFVDEKGKRAVTLEQLSLMFHCKIEVESFESGICFSEVGTIEDGVSDIECLDYREYYADFCDDFNCKVESLKDYAMRDFISYVQKERGTDITSDDVEVIEDEEDNVRLRLIA